MADSDGLRRFVFEGAGVRGALVHLDASWQAVLDRHPYPPAVQRPLGQVLAAAVLLSSTIKFEGTLILQVEAEGPVRTLVAQATDRRTLRGLARWEGEVPDGGGLAETFGAGRLVLTASAPGGDRYQGVVALEGATLAGALEAYFAQSEQLPTRLWLAVDGPRAAGLLLQRLPGPTDDEDAWRRTAMLADTLRDAELLKLGTKDLLRRLFHEETVRLFEAEPVAFRCGCSRERVDGLLRALGREEVDEVLTAQGAIEVTCEFCNRVYRLDRVDAELLFRERGADVTDTRH
ncbi:MAG: Hsp33 family molecular chaperone HslO [Gammaproteobacteria bacterium]|jgi:molecular chaperone Hsp33|nr:Hsp33 family molecular chaperone HslO [Gammaproteobacteria bacterium]